MDKDFVEQFPIKMNKFLKRSLFDLITNIHTIIDTLSVFNKVVFNKNIAERLLDSRDKLISSSNYEFYVNIQRQAYVSELSRNLSAITLIGFGNNM